jgi:site-specific DNA-methyltransferase (adenine-specific)
MQNKGQGMIKLFNGEALEEMDKLIEDGVVVDAIITDPPYGTTACKWDSVIPFDEMWSRLNKLIKPNGAIVLFGSEPFSSALRMSNINNYKYDWVWDKRYPANYPQAKRQPMKRHENILVFNSSIDTYYPQMVLRDKPIKKGKNCGADVFNKGLEKEEYKGKVYTHQYPVSIQYFPTRQEGKKIHPTQKPVALMEYLIKTYTNEGETVLDFTMGSGTTGVACKNIGRDFIGIELDEKYFEIARKRIDDTERSLF